jgi:hypothetical protein
VEIIQYLNNSEIFNNYKILDYKSFLTWLYIKILIILPDNSKLFISEYIDESNRNYSYHWQDRDDNLIMRFDNAPNHKDINTYPNHYHQGNSVFPTDIISFQEILNYIQLYYTDKL